ncbi:MAG: ABC transporter substrate-binding protein, partial [Snodgrassella alvi]|nr:ABC transporter substrate-binding protein [Snodgrassella alvi]
MLRAKQTLMILGLAAACLLTACSPSGQSENTGTDNHGMKKVAITAIVEHPALDAVRQGVIDELRNEGYEQGKNLKLDFQSAQGNTATAGQIAKKFAGSNPDAIVAIGTPSAQSMVAATRNIPVVFAAVTDPVAAKLVPSWEPSKTNVTGVSDELPLQPQIALMKQVVPNLKTVGYVYSPGEVNSTVVLGQLQSLLAKDGINVAAAPAQRTTDVPMATKSL